MTADAAPVATTAVVHLLRAANGDAPFARFLTTYRTFPAGAEHQLVLVCKGFGHALPSRLVRLVDDLQPHVLHVSDRGFDIGPYRTAAKRLDTDAVCFLNSFSTILAPDWLAKLLGALNSPGVGIAGATGSWQSLFSAGFRPGWRTPFPHQPGRWPRWLGRRYRWLKYRTTYPPFPNPHVRSNAFVIRRQDFLSLKVPPTVTKQFAYRFESGYQSLTRQMERRGVRPVVVDREGRSAEIAEWYDSHTFWAGDQENLLVADNQTENYRRGTPASRRALELAAWRAGPTPRTLEFDPAAS